MSVWAVEFQSVESNPTDNMRILAVDPGSKRIGLAISDLTGTIATSLKVLDHVSRIVDASAVADLATSNDAGLIVIGQSYNDDGQPSYEGRRAGRFAETLRALDSHPDRLLGRSFYDIRCARDPSSDGRPA